MTTDYEFRPDAGGAPQSAPEAPPAGAPVANAIGTRNLMIVIITMPLVFLIVVMATISVIGRPGADKNNGRTELTIVDAAEIDDYSDLDLLTQPSAAPYRGVTLPTSAAALAIDPSPLVIPAGAKIGAMALDGDRLVLRVEGAKGDEIIIYDLARGAAEQRIRILEQMQSVDGGL